jgi:16S rRNA (guanine527-N7)-methyltransferase
MAPPRRQPAMNRSRQDVAALSARYGLPPGTADSLTTLLELLAPPEAPTSVHDPAEGARVHVADSLAGLDVPELAGARVVADLGSGGGLPGLVLAAALPRARVVLIESVGRKCEFLRGAAEAMGLENAEVVWARAEEWSDGLGRCDVVCARALAALPVLCEYAAPLLTDGGVLVAWKGAIAPEEAEDAAAAADHLGLRPEPVRSVVPFPGSERRTLHVLRKIRPTPPTFPRRPGMATKRPLTARKLR